jgi:hypothetical protein
MLNSFHRDLQKIYFKKRLCIRAIFAARHKQDSISQSLCHTLNFPPLNYLCMYQFENWSYREHALVYSIIWKTDILKENGNLKQQIVNGEADAM